MHASDDGIKHQIFVTSFVRYTKTRTVLTHGHAGQLPRTIHIFIPERGCVGGASIYFVAAYNIIIL